MTLGSISGIVPTMQAPRTEVEAVDEQRVTIDFPPLPDDVRLRSQSTGCVSMAGCTSGISGLVTLVLGLVGLGTAAYVCVEANKQVDNAAAGSGSQWLGYGFGGSVGVLAGMMVTYGLGQVCYAAARRREARDEMLTQREQARFESTMGGLRP
ncbi:hypothetical protein [Pandoraea terrigena]|uniref:Transmembrane protein n=1 Tax=Pandoraea terrigena TaxID=2508292 RepID=A0A5E4SIR0_9BURK|nr:hypothetical protein [Pandoraea terrigena]VVD74324.1 hypothetical protein PTE31013_00789 [Pandoraea terrigena]